MPEHETADEPIVAPTEDAAPPASNKVHPSLAAALAERGYDRLTPVQAAVVAADAGDRDLLVSAQTGSGKTVAYGLALAPTLLASEERFGRADLPLALVIAPTRELALQVKSEFDWLYAATGVRMATAVGGMDIRKEQRALDMGAHIVVGTPGRLRDHLERGRLDISALKAVVLDEADEMLDLGFREDLELILDAAPAERRTLLFSATLPREIVRLARQYQRDAHRIDTIVENQPHGDIEYRAIRVAPNEIEHAVVNTLRFFEVPAALVFCATRESVRHLHASLVERGFSAVALSGELSQTERNHALQALRDGRARVCVATDVAARGLDLPDLGLVIHAELPTGSAVLLHRSGRTGRAGRKGISAMLVPLNQRAKALRLIRDAGVEAWWQSPPSAEAIQAQDRERLVERLSASEPASAEELPLAQLLLEKLGPETVAAALVRLQKSSLPEPEELYDPGPTPEDRRAAAGKGERRRPRDEHAPAEAQQGGARAGQGEMVWFRLSVGRQKNADPKWLLPLICRRGHVTRNEIGAIKIGERDTTFEVAAEAAERFATALRRGGDEEIRIEPMDGERGGSQGRPPRGKGGKSFGGTPYGEKSFGSKPFGGKRSSDGPTEGKRSEGKPFGGPRRVRERDGEGVERKQFRGKPKPPTGE